MVNKTKIKPELKIWLQAGTQDEKADRNQNGIIDAIDDTTDLVAALYNKGFKKQDDVNYVETVGGKHDVATWALMMPKYLTWAFGY